MQRRPLLITLAAVIVIAGGWYLFRPERLWINKDVSESLPASAAVQTPTAQMTDPQPLLTGRFHKGSHETRGVATVYQLADGKRLLRLTDFETSNGPDVQVYLVAAADAKDNETVTKAGFVRLDDLKGNRGDQNYDLPGDVDLDKYRAVTIWCRRFGVNFGTAPLMTATDMSGMPAAPQALLSGQFHGVAHPTTGTAIVYQLPDGRRLLRFTGFETSNGPDVQVYLVAAADAKDNATVTQAGFIRVDELKGNRGDQNYELPAGVDLDRYRAVTIWCRRFGVNFATAPLAPQHS